MEQNLADFARTYNQGLWIATIAVAAVLAARLYFLLRNLHTRHWIGKARGNAYVLILKAVFFAGLIAFLFDLPVWFLMVAQFVPIAPALPYHALILVLLLLTLLELGLCFTFSEALQQQFIKRILFFLVSIFVSTSFIMASLIVPGTFRYPATEDCVELELPVKGTWLALHAGEAPWVNYHSNSRQQKYAVDLVKLGPDNRFFMEEGASPEQFYTFADSVFSPADGQVVAVIDGHPAQPVLHGGDTLHPAGNYVQIAIGNNKYLFLEHLLNGSVRVSAGDTLRQLQFIGLAGNSGNTSFPHLHMHVQNRTSLEDTTASGQPIRFNALQRNRYGWWQMVEHASLLRNDLIQR